MDLNLIQPDGNITAVLQFMGKSYNLSQFSTSFTQSTDDKGEPQAEVQGGKLLAVLSQVPDNNLLHWASNQWSRKDGEIVFRNETGTPPLRITFKEAYCVDLNQVSIIGGGSKTSLIISPKEVSMNSCELFNDWKES